MIHPDVELRFIDAEIGFGVFATRFIPQGTIVWVLDDLDQILTPQRIAALDPDRRAVVDRYAYRDPSGNFVLCWDLGRYVNHSFCATCVGTAYDLELAARDIHPGEQVTDDYGTLNLEVPFAARAEAGSDRTTVLPSDLVTYAADYDRIALRALRFYERVRQPLAHLVRPAWRAKLVAAARTGVLMDSLASTYHRESVAA